MDKDQQEKLNEYDLAIASKQRLIARARRFREQHSLPVSRQEENWQSQLDKLTKERDSLLSTAATFTK